MTKIFKSVKSTKYSIFGNFLQAKNLENKQKV